MYAKATFCIKASVLFLTLLLSSLVGHAAEQAIGPGDSSMSENHINDNLNCDSDGVCEDFESPAIIAQHISMAAHDIFNTLRADGQEVALTICEKDPEFPEELKCNVSNADNPLTLSCNLYASAGTGNASCGDLYTLGIDLHCNANDSASDGCDTNIDPIKLCQADQASCESVVARAKLCESGAIDCHYNAPRKSNKEVFTDVVSASCRNNVDSNENDFSQFCAVLAANPGQEDQIIAAVMPSKLDLSSDAGMMSMQQVSTYISSRLTQLRQTPVKVSSTKDQSKNLYPVAGQWLPAFTQLAQLEGMSMSASDVSPVVNDSLDATINISQDGRFSLYVNASFMYAQQDSTSDEAASDSKTAQITLGSDYRLSNDWVLGAAFSFSDMNNDFGNNKEDSLNQQSYNLSLYTLYYHKQWWLDGSLLLGFNRYDQERDITCSGSCSSLTNTYEANYNGNVQSLTLSSGYDFVFSRLTLSPFAQLQGGTVNIEAYDESAQKTGPTALLSLDKQSRDFANINIGSYLRYVLNTKKAVVIPSLRVVLNHSLEDDIQSVSGHFVGDESARFSMAANAMDDTYLTLGTGINFQLQNGNSGFIDLETIEAYDNLKQYRITGGWRWEF